MIIDLRSDTITIPNKGMLNAMMSANVGDDVWEEDFTVKDLEKKIASIFGMEAGLFCPSGTMTNQIAIRVHTKLGDELVCDKLSHIYNYEGGGIASNSGVSTRLLDGENGILSLDQIKSSTNPDDPHFPRTKLVCLENTVNKGGGVCYSMDSIIDISNFCRNNNLFFHLDGARIFNALVKTSQKPIDYGKNFDSISICLSKGLGAPVGSVLLGSEDFIYESKRVRKSFGGGMRQAGYLAAAGIYALDNNVNRLKEDHDRAKIIYEKLCNCNYVTSILPCETNIVIFEISNIYMRSFCDHLDMNGIKYSLLGSKIRFVTHLNFTDDHLNKVIDLLSSFKLI
ncbi:MAG: threonine aldolase [Flavobacteriales bacterium TMED113]|nr:MAG: threonine aldolase [Flavobacteriales bacterium TMED113]